MSSNPKKYFIRRLLGLIPVLFIIVTISFFLMRLAPGGPFDQEKSFSAETEQSMKELYGLDKPLVLQYLIYLKNVCTGDLGYSFTYLNEPVSRLIRDSFKTSFVLGLSAFSIALFFGLLAGILSAVKKGTFIDYLFFTFTIFGVSVPAIVLAPLLIIIFGRWLGLFPVAGWGSFSHIILPALALGTVYACFIARLTRASLIETLSKDHVKAQRGMGVAESKIIMKYVFKGSLLPLISYLGPAFAGIITGSLVIERIFRINGLGEHFVQAALNRDYTLALGAVIFYSAVLLIVNFICDILYTLVDPRITNE